MECREALERILESFDEALAPLEKSQLERHIADCSECAEFAALQTLLDLRLHEQISAPQLSVGFRAGLQARIAREPRERWPDWLPDVAHLAGCAAAIGFCTLLLPLPVPVVLGTGFLISLVTYSLQALLVSALEQKTD